MGDGEGAVVFALFADALGPEGEGEVGPVVVALVEGLPGFLEGFLPLGQAEEFPQRAGGDDHAVVEVGLPARRPMRQGGVQGAEFGEEISRQRYPSGQPLFFDMQI